MVDAVPARGGGSTSGVRKTVWQMPQCESWVAFAAGARRRAGLDAGGWQRALWHGGVFLGRARIDGTRPPERVDAGTWVRVYTFVEPPDPVRLESSVILLQRAGVVAINKPAGMVVQGTRASWRLCVEAALRELCQASWLYAAHRLDRGTSGVLLFADSPTAFAHLQQQFARRQVCKRYLAWVRPVPAVQRWTVEGWMVRVPHPQHACYALRRTADEGRFSATRFEIVRTDGECALVLAEPRTGRTHQIRVHLAAGGTPIVGDGLYGPAREGYGGAPQRGPGGGEDDARRPMQAGAVDAPTSRLCLHAAALQVRLPGEDEPVWIRAARPADFDPPQGVN